MRNKSAGGEVAGAKIPGGASGIPEKAGAAAPLPVNPAAMFRGRDPNAVPVKRYRVVNGGSIVLNGFRTPIRAGKEISEQQYDVRELRKQGLKLEEIVEDKEPEPVVELGPEPVSPSTAI